MIRFVPSREVCEVVEDVVDTCLHYHYDSKSEETFIECLMCGEWEGHTQTCLIPTILAWQVEDK